MFPPAVQFRHSFDQFCRPWLPKFGCSNLRSSLGIARRRRHRLDRFLHLRRLAEQGAPAGARHSEWNDFTAQAPADRRVLVWKLANGKVVREFPAGKDRVVDLCWSKDGNELRWITRGGELLTGNLTGGEIKVSSVPAGEVAFVVFPESLLTTRATNPPLRDVESTNELLILRGLNPEEKLAALADKDWHFTLAQRKLPLQLPQSAVLQRNRILFGRQPEAWNPQTGERISLWTPRQFPGVPRPAWADGQPLCSVLSPDGSRALVMTTGGRTSFVLKIRRSPMPKCRRV